MAEKRQMPDEISAINRIGRILEALEDDERRRVLAWMVDKFGNGEDFYSVKLTRPTEGAVNGQ